MNERQKETILEELMDALGLRPIQSHEITAEDLADRSGLSVDAARRQLHSLVRQGGWCCAYRRKNNQRRLAFWKTEDEHD